MTLELMAARHIAKYTAVAIEKQIHAHEGYKRCVLLLGRTDASHIVSLQQLVAKRYADARRAINDIEPLWLRNASEELDDDDD